MSLALMGAGKSSPGGGSPAPFDPSTITGLVSWLKADALTLADGDPVAVWTDSSSANNSPDQASGPNQPHYKTGIVNGQPVVRFVGSGTQQLQWANVFSSLTAGTAFFAVKIVTDPPPANTGLWTFGTGTGSHYPAGDGAIYETFGTTTRKDSIAAPALDQWRVYEVYTGASDYGVVLDGTSLFTTATNTVGFTTACKLGQGANAMDGDIAEFLLYDSKLSSGNRSSVRGYLGTKYGITVV